MAEAPVQPGDVLAGKYRVERVLGAGGIGVVVAARHLILDQMVALKFLHDWTASSPQTLERFTREARAAAKLRCEHVARVLDVEKLEGGAPFIVMEYLVGADLAELIGKRPLPIPEAVTYVLQACEAMAEAHAAGIVHRDLKPANLFRTTAADGSAQIKVLDFGIAKVTTPGTGDDHSLTNTRALMGSPLYMSPEQLESARDVDGRADIWALGAILYEAIAGRPPFYEESLPRLCVSILQKEPAPPSTHAPHVPPALDALVLRCIAKRRGDRFQNVQELAQALEPFAPAHALESIRRTLSTSQSVPPQHISVAADTSPGDEEAPTARAPSYAGLSPTQPMDALAGTGPTGARVWVTSDGAPASTAPGPLGPSRPPGRRWVPLLLGAVATVSALIAIGAVLSVRFGRTVAAPSASAPTLESVVVPQPPAPVSSTPAPSASTPAPPPLASSAPQAKPSPSRVISKPVPKPKTGSGVLSNDRE